MKIKRLNNDNICQINSSIIDDKTLEYITFNMLEKTGLVNHMFSTRIGGVSTGIYNEMNLGFSNGDEKANVIENYKRISKVMGYEIDDIVRSAQTHTTNVRVVTESDKGKGFTKEMDYTDIDGLITNVPGIVLTTSFADCVPLYILDPIHKAIGLSHSGWRGTVNRMGKATLQKMKEEYDTNPEDVLVVIGPSICQKCYEVSEDVANSFIEEFNTSDKNLLYKKDNGKYQLNLHYANELVFKEAGVKIENIETTDICTSCNSNYLFSHRKTNGKRGNLGAFMALK